MRSSTNSLTADNSSTSSDDARARRYNSLSRANNLPVEAFQRNGCLYCEWRIKKELCPFYHDSDKSFGICDKRVDWLLHLSPKYSEVPSLSQWNRDFSISLKQSLIPDYIAAEKDARSNLALLDHDNPANHQIINRLTRDLEMYHRFWENLDKQVLHYEDQQVNRDTPKKLDVNTTHRLDLDDIHRLMRNVTQSTAKETITIKPKDDI